MNYKRSKFGELPGDWPRDRKIRILEKNKEFYIWPWQICTLNCIKVFRNIHYKRANRRFRYKKYDCIE